MKLLAIAISLFQISLNCVSQDIHTDLKKISKNYYHNQECLKYIAKIYYYSIENRNEIFDSIVSTYYKQNWNIYMNLGEIEMLLNNKYQIIADNKYKTLSIDNAPKLNSNLYSIGMIDTLLFSQDFQMRLIYSNLNTNKISMTYENNLIIDSVEFSYNTKTYFINEMIMYYKNSSYFHADDFEPFKPVIKIIFSNQAFIKPTADQFNVSRFIVEKNNLFVATNAYRNYKVLNKLNQ